MLIFDKVILRNRKWAFSVKNKVKTAGVLFLLCVVVLLSNFRMKYLSECVTEGVETIYKDRFLVQDLIFSYSRILEDVEDVLVLEGNTQPEFEKNFVKIELLNNKYRATKLTEEESEVFHAFSDKLEKIRSSIEDKVLVQKSLIAAREDLVRLEAIQMEEAKKEMVAIAKLDGSRQLSFYLEAAILIVLLIIVQTIVLTATSLKNKFTADRIHLN